MKIRFTIQLVFSFFLSFYFNEVKSQDIQFSQFYATPLYINPAFAGSAHADRIIFHQRLQWPGLDARYTTSFLSYDRFFGKYKSGLGMYFLKDWQGGKIINSTEGAIQYSYEINFSGKLALRPGLQFGVINRSLDYASLKYPDQFDDQGLTGAGTMDPHFNNSAKKTFVDIGTGAVLYTKKLWFSYAASHINTPDQSSWDQNSILLCKHSITAGYRIEPIKGVKKDHIGHSTSSLYLIPTVHYKAQGKSDQLDAGLYLYYGQFVTGVWYRGIPIKQYNSSLPNNESIVGILGWRIKELRLSYSYDFVISKLQVARTGGAHELNLSYLFNNKKCNKRPRPLPCPEF